MSGEKKGAAGTTAREDFGGRELATIGETAITAAAAQARAAVEARYVMAVQRPRDFDQARFQLLKECARFTFADSATYEMKIGGKTISGPSIRFAEAAVRALRNIFVETTTIYDDAEKRVLRVSVTDLEANVPYSQEVVVEKTVERRELRDGQVALGQRKNFEGKVVYRVAADEGALLAKQGALVSKLMRTLALRLVPGDLIDEALEACAATVHDGISKDPDAHRKKIADSFARIGVQPSGLRDFLGHDLGTCSPKELAELRGTYQAISEGATTWAETLTSKQVERAKPSTAASPGAAPTTEAPAKPPEKLKSVAELRAEAVAKRAAPEAPAPGAKP